MRRPLMLWPLILALLLLALGGLYGGIAMLADPSGQALGVDGVIDQLPVSDYFLPGIFLAMTFGLAPLLVAFALIARPDWSWLDRFFGWSKHYWAWTGCLLLVGVIALWLTYEGLLIGMFPITYFTAVLGLAIFLFAIVPSVRKYYSNSP